MDPKAWALCDYPIQLGLGATAQPQPQHSGDASWYEAYAARHSGDGAEGRLVTQHTFETWRKWEMHPGGSEVVLVLAGTMTLIQELEGGERRLQLIAGQYAINPAGVWHTADTRGPVTAVFITAGAGTQHRPRA
jgi:mannose-6-phosphate isomerase-like protein (cupin superfamily)